MGFCRALEPRRPVPSRMSLSELPVVMEAYVYLLYLDPKSIIALWLFWVAWVMILHTSGVQVYDTLHGGRKSPRASNAEQSDDEAQARRQVQRPCERRSLPASACCHRAVTAAPTAVGGAC